MHLKYGFWAFNTMICIQHCSSLCVSWTGKISVHLCLIQLLNTLICDVSNTNNSSVIMRTSCHPDDCVLLFALYAHSNFNQQSFIIISNSSEREQVSLQALRGNDFFMGQFLFILFYVSDVEFPPIYVF